MAPNIDELNVYLNQITIQAKTFLKDMIEIKVIKLKLKVLNYFWNKRWSETWK